MNNDSNVRWWEFYLVRYFVGTVCGTLIVLFLVLDKGSTVHQLITNQVPSVKDAPQGGIHWEATHLWVYGLIGLAYCYIASGPILFLHTMRGIFGGKGPFTFYQDLSKQRAKRSDSKQMKEYVESYKHLREHGNAFFIVLCELILGFILYKGNSWIIAIIGFLWILLPVTAWFIGTYLEKKLSDIKLQDIKVEKADSANKSTK